MTDQERRAHPRINVDDRVRYRTEEMTGYEQGELVNISQDGILLWTQHNVKIGEAIYLIIDSDEKDAAPIEIKAKVIRYDTSVNQDGVGCGCLIIEKSDIE